MKILHINSYYSGSMFYKNLYDYQLRSGIDISVFVPVSLSKINDKDFGAYTTISKNHNKFDRYIFHLKQHKINKDLMERYDLKKYSIIHAHSLFTNGYAAMKIKKDFNIPYVVAVRNTDVNIFLKKMIHLRRIGIKILENADRIIFLSEPYRDEVLERYVPSSKKAEIYDKTSVIPNGIDDFWFDNIGIEKSKLEKSKIKLLQIGEINKNKNIETTVKAIDFLIEKGYEVKLDAVGKVKDRKVFKKIKNLSYINYLGYKSKDELITIYRDNDIFILPSINETFGLVYAEAMSQGLPVLYSRGQGFDGQFSGGMIGFGVNATDPQDIANRIIEVNNNYSSISKECVINVKRFSWSEISERYTSIYLELN